MPTTPIPSDLTELLAPYKDEWVALSHDERHVLGHGKTLDEALAEAQECSKDRPFIIKVSDPALF